jgi:NAD(P)H-dependent FMN reductase
MEVIVTDEKSNRRVLGIVGSPRRSGNTETLVDEALFGAEKAGALIEKVILNELDIASCQACGGCEKTGECVQQDDMAELLGKMARSQVWVLGTPVYWWGPTAQFKTFLDRWYGVERAVFAGRRVVIVMPLGDGASYARYAMGMLTDIVDYLGMRLVATVLAPGASGRGSVRQRADLMAQARRAGQEAVALSS